MKKHPVLAKVLFVAGVATISIFLAVLTAGFILQRTGADLTPGMVVARYLVMPKESGDLGAPGRGLAVEVAVDSICYFVLIYGSFSVFRHFRATRGRANSQIPRR